MKIFLKLWERRQLVGLWTLYNIQGRYVETRLGLFWIILQPIVYTIIYSIVFSNLLLVKPRGGIPFTVFFLSGLTIWELINSNIMQSSIALVSKLSLISQSKFPREIILVVFLCEKIIDFFTTFIILIIISSYFGIYPTWNYLFLPVYFFAVFSFLLGVSFIVSSLGVFVRDVDRFVGIGLRFLFYFSGVIFSLDMLPENIQPILSLNPILLMVETFRNIVILNESPNINSLLTLLGLGYLILVIGYKFFKSREGTFVDYI
ncbi:MAG: ABC transporter permease [Candidatus Heimdallarchaeota archaeon]|nr:ABC transporter permease [Candidatus Heimdallarchaeota archaeon]